MQVDSSDSRRLDPFGWWRTLKAVWFAVLFALILAIAVGHVAQIREILLDAADPVLGHRFLALLTALAFAAGAFWYFSRALLYVNHARRETQPGAGALALAIGLALLLLVLWPAAAGFGLILIGVALLFLMLRPLRDNRQLLREERPMLVPVTVTVAGIFGVMVLAPSLWAIILAGIVLVALLALFILAGRSSAEEDGSAHAPVASRFELWLPRFLGLLVVLPPALVYASAGLWTAAGLVALTGVLFLLAVVLRRQGIAGGPIAALGDAVLRPVRYHRLERLPVRTFVAMLWLMTASFALAAGLVYWGAPFAQFLGSSALIYLAAASWVAFAHVVLIYPARRFRILPPVLVLPVVAWAVGQIAEKHVVTPCDSGCADDSDYSQPAAEAHFSQWLEQRSAVIAQRAGSGQTYPVFVVAAEGGGVRAGYWTGNVLARLEDRYPGFHCHVYAISGVSGGALGASVFAALAANQEAAGAGRCFNPDTRWPDAGYGVEASAALADDFLAPVAAGLLFSDLIGLFVPLQWPGRGVLLEQAITQGWRRGTGSGRFSQSFHSLWATDATRWSVPGLMLNITQVESGRRVVAANFSIEDSRPRDYSGLTDLWQLTGPLRLSSVVHLSARFPYVSPAGYLPNPEVSLVDGGYFENSGALTAHETLRMVHRRFGDSGAAVTPVALVLRNATAAAPAKLDNSLVREAIAPLATLLATRESRGDYALQELRGFMCGKNPGCRLTEAQENSRYIVISLDADTLVPFAWSLTKDSERRMDRAIDQLLDQPAKEATKLHAWLDRRAD